MAKIKPLEIRPAQGGALVTALSPEAPGLTGYLVKRDYRRVDDGEERVEGHDYLRPNASIPLGNQPMFLEGEEVTLIHEVKRPNGERCLVVGTQTKLWRFVTQTGGGYYDSDYYTSAADYFSSNPGEWILIGEGFSASGKRWQAADINGYVVLNNGVDLPVTYRVEELAVTPIYELRELGVASVGCINEFLDYLVLGNVRQVQEQDLAGLMGLLNSGATIGVQGNRVAGQAVIGTIAAGSTILNASGGLFGAIFFSVGDIVRFTNGFTAKIVALIPAGAPSSNSVLLDTAPDMDISAGIFIITRPRFSASGTVRDTNVLEAYWNPPGAGPWDGSAVFTDGSGTTYNMEDSTWYVMFENGWSSMIASVTDFKTAVLDQTPPMDIIGMGFTIYPKLYVMTLSHGSFVFTDAMVGQEIFSGYKKRRLLSVVAGSNGLKGIMNTDYNFNGPIVMTNPAAYAAYTGRTDGLGYRVMWCGKPGEPQRWAASTPATMLTGDTRVVLDYPMKSLKVGDAVAVLGAGAAGGNLLTTITFIAGAVVLVADAASTSITSAGGGLIARQDAIGTAAGFEDLVDDGSSILAMEKLGRGKALIIFRETSIFIGADSGQAVPPFAFDITYGGAAARDERSGCLAFSHAVGNVEDQKLVYPAAGDFYTFDLINRTPQIFVPLHDVANLFYEVAEASDEDGVFVVENPITRELVWFYPTESDNADKCLRYDYVRGTVSTSPLDVSAAGLVSRPVTDSTPDGDMMFVMACRLPVTAPAGDRVIVSTPDRAAVLPDFMALKDIATGKPVIVRVKDGQAVASDY